MAAKTAKQQEAADRYLKEKVDEFKVRVPKGKKSVIKAHAETQKESLNSFVCRAIDTQIKLDQK